MTIIVGRRKEGREAEGGKKEESEHKEERGSSCRCHRGYGESSRFAITSPDQPSSQVTHREHQEEEEEEL